MVLTMIILVTLNPYGHIKSSYRLPGVNIFLDYRRAQKYTLHRRER